MQLTIDSVKTAPSGKSLVVKAGGKDYFAKVASGIQAGMTIDAEIETSQFNGKTNTWIGKYKQVNAAPPSDGSQTANKAGGSQAGSAAAPIWANFVSNQVAHAIAAGYIKEPHEIKLWAAAAKQAFVELV